MDKKFGVIIVVVTLFVLVGGIFLLGGKASSQSLPKDQTVLVGDARHSQGNRESKVTVVEIADFQCSACATVHPLVQSLLEDYKGKIFFVYRQFPMSQHSNSLVSAEAAEAAGGQGKFWEMYDLLYAKQQEWQGSQDPLEVFTRYASDLGLDTEVFRKELEEHKYKSLIDGDMKDALSVGLSATPTFYINGYQFSGSFTDLKKEIEKYL